MGLGVKYSLLLSDFNEIDFLKYSYHTFLENQCSVSRIVPRGWTNGRTDRHDNLVVAFCSFANAPKSQLLAHKKLVNTHDILL